MERRGNDSADCLELVFLVRRISQRRQQVLIAHEPPTSSGGQALAPSRQTANFRPFAIRRTRYTVISWAQESPKS